VTRIARRHVNSDVKRRFIFRERIHGKCKTPHKKSGKKARRKAAQEAKMKKSQQDVYLPALFAY
jgi:hypothetical protein